MVKARNVLAGILLLQWVILAPGAAVVFLRPVTVPPAGTPPVAVAAWAGELGVKLFVIVGLPALAVWVADLTRLREAIRG